MDLLNGIDHVLFATDDLDTAADQWRRLGFTLTPAIQHGTGPRGHEILLAHSRLDLVAGLDAPPGPHALAYGTDHPGEVHDKLGGDGPMEITRRIDDGPPLRVIALRLAADALPGPPSLACQPEDPDALRRPEWCRHPNTALALEAITLAVPDPEAAAAGWRQIPGARRETGNGTPRVMLGPHVLRFVPGAPEIRQLDLRVGDLAVTAEWLKGSGLAHHALDDTLTITIGGTPLRFHGSRG